MDPQTTNTTTVLVNGASTASELFALTDEQILEIDPEPQGVQVQDAEPVGKSAPGSDVRRAETTAEASTSAGAAPSAIKTETATPDTVAPATPADATATQANASAPAPFSSPDDIRALAELYPGGIAQAKSTAERARTLDEIDAAYFGATGYSPEQVSAARAQLAATMLREDPVAFREMVFEGLRALEQAGGPPPVAAVFRPRGLDADGAPASSAAANASVAGATLESPISNTTAGLTDVRPVVANRSADTGHGTRITGHESPITSQQPDLAAYATFEKAANADLEKSVGGAIDRALQQALPNLERAGERADGQARHAVPLQTRLSQAIREDVERALQADRQLGEQVAQILAARRFDHETRAQVVRLINDRALQLVSIAAKHALNDWTQATLAAHRSRTTRSEATASRREVAPASLPANLRGSQQQAVAHPVPAQPGFRGEAQTRSAAQTPRAGTHTAGKGRVDYRKLSDEQILNL